MLIHKRFLILILLGNQVLGLEAQRMNYIAPYFGISRFTGEIENNQFLFWSPLGPMSRPTAGFILGTRYKKSLSIEMHTDLSFYGGNSRYSNPNTYYIGKSEGRTLMFGLAIDKKFKSGYDLGVGFNHGMNQFSEKLVGQNVWTTFNTQNNSLMFRLSKRLKWYENKSEILFRYSLVYNLKDNWDPYNSGVINDYLILGQFVFIIPTKNLKLKKQLDRRGMRSKRYCPEF